MSKKIITLILICLMSVTISACSKPEAIDGTWSMIRQEHADGTVYEGDDLPVHEYYVIDGDEAKYSLKETNWYLTQATGRYTISRKQTLFRKEHRHKY